MASALCVFALQIMALIAIASSEPTMDVTPSEICLGVTSKLAINCTFSADNYPDMAAFISMGLSRANASGQNIKELAVITEFAPDSVTLATTEKFSATGVHRQTGESFLSITWDYPTATQAGVYQCSARGVDKFGHNMDMVNISVVTVDQADINDVFERLREMEIYEASMEKEILTLKNTTLVQEKYIETLESDIVDLKYILPMNLTGTFGDKNYYVSKESVGPVDKVRKICETCGGMLAEIDDEDEYKAIQGLLNATAGFNHILIGGRYSASNGNWILPSNNKPLPFVAWYPDQPDDISATCLWLYSAHSWQMGDSYCDLLPKYHELGFLCEIPSN